MASYIRGVLAGVYDLREDLEKFCASDLRFEKHLLLDQGVGDRLEEEKERLWRLLLNERESHDDSICVGRLCYDKIRISEIMKAFFRMGEQGFYDFLYEKGLISKEEYEDKKQKLEEKERKKLEKKRKKRIRKEVVDTGSSEGVPSIKGVKVTVIELDRGRLEVKHAGEVELTQEEVLKNLIAGKIRKYGKNCFLEEKTTSYT